MLVVVAGRFGGPRYTPPMNRVWPHAGMVAACGVAYGLSVTHIAPHLAIPGLIGLTQMVVSTWLVPRMIPRVAGGSTMDDIVRARFDYSRLDEPSSRVRLRLSSTAVRVEHDGAPDSADRVAITYVRGGRAGRVWARSCVLAGYNAMIPYLCPELPDRQREALALAVKVPIIYSTVLLRNWRAWKEIGIGAVSAPGSYHANAMLDFPVSLGATSSPEVRMIRSSFTWSDSGRLASPALTPREQFRAERHRMLATPFSEIEREIRTQLTGTLASGGFDPAGHRGHYRQPLGARICLLLQPLFDEVQSTPRTTLPHVIGRARFGRIAVANSDAGALAHDRLGDRPGSSSHRGSRSALRL